MRRSLLLALVALACLAMPNPVLAQFTRCMYFSGTADALIKSNAVDESQKSLRKAIDKWEGRDRRDRPGERNGREAEAGPLLAKRGRPQPVPSPR